eukprot:m.505222 g.505222  ORF g.505222 m.505222 type:complete len:207 (+) comp57363_c0_seq4:301-921(+)
MPIKGSCLTIEKEFLRLTAAPNAALVRPLAVLQQALVHVQKKWQQEPNYKWAWSQLKSIRQDLTIQGIRNEFTVKVYETHARICLQQGDQGEFNQCQNQLLALYDEEIQGCEVEFTAYHILYNIYANNPSASTTFLADLSDHIRADPIVKHALAVRSAQVVGDYHRFFKLYKVGNASHRAPLMIFQMHCSCVLRLVVRAARTWELI